MADTIHKVVLFVSFLLTQLNVVFWGHLVYVIAVKHTVGAFCMNLLFLFHFLK